MPNSPFAIEIQNLSFAYGDHEVLQNINLNIPNREITALIGSSGCGKSTLLRCINRIHDRTPNAKITKGQILVHGININQNNINLRELRRRVGMVFQKYNPFPTTIFENVVFGLKIHGISDRQTLAHAAESALKSAALWDEVKDRLNSPALALSGGQQQRLCIARAIATEPNILLLDEPCAALDPIATLKIEELLLELKQKFTIVIVTHNMAQASRCSDHTAFLHLGQLIEFNPTLQIFSQPQNSLTEAYLSGTMG